MQLLRSPAGSAAQVGQGQTAFHLEVSAGGNRALFSASQDLSYRRTHIVVPGYMSQDACCSSMSNGKKTERQSSAPGGDWLNTCSEILGSR